MELRVGEGEDEGMVATGDDTRSQQGGFRSLPWPRRFLRLSYIHTTTTAAPKLPPSFSIAPTLYLRLLHGHSYSLTRQPTTNEPAESNPPWPSIIPCSITMYAARNQPPTAKLLSPAEHGRAHALCPYFPSPITYIVHKRFVYLPIFNRACLCSSTTKIWLRQAGPKIDWTSGLPGQSSVTEVHD